jgi:hypothetical protein
MPMIESRAATRLPHRKGAAMQFAEAHEGDWRIYAGALEARGGGYTAAVVVQHAAAAREAWRDDALACGYRWPSAEEALRYAVARGRDRARAQRARAAEGHR